MGDKNKTYQITVHGTRNVEPVVFYEYRVEAEDQSAAEAAARDDYLHAYPDIDNAAIYVSLKGGWNTYAIVCMAIACLLSCVGWHSSKGEKLSLAPDFISMLFAVFIYSAFVIRNKGLQSLLNRRSEIALVCLNLFFCASFLTLFVGKVTFAIPFTFGLGKVTFSGFQILCLAGLLSWLCIRAVAGVVWLLLFLIAIKHIGFVSGAMGGWGVVYVLSAFLGVVFQLKQESPYLLKSVRNDILGIYAGSAKRVRKDISASAGVAKSIAGAVANVAASAAVGAPVNLSTKNTGASTNAEKN